MHRCSKSIQGVPCQFPFAYNDQLHDKCLPYGNGLSFCGLYDAKKGLQLQRVNDPNEWHPTITGPCEENCENEGMSKYLILLL